MPGKFEFKSKKEENQFLKQKYREAQEDLEKIQKFNEKLKTKIEALEVKNAKLRFEKEQRGKQHSPFALRPASSPWTLCIVLAQAGINGQNVALQQWFLLLQNRCTIGICIQFYRLKNKGLTFVILNVYIVF